MERYQYMDAMDCLDDARNRLGFISSMFSAANPDSFELGESSLAGFCELLRGIDDLLEEAEHFINEERAKSDLKKGASARVAGHTETPIEADLNRSATQ
ncbi:MAG: hypothetical protein JRJ85_12120 [Deltaproteobacteria bacterium]|nr:hypothetical protein [Deltaproteobacteria bacterium]